MPLIIMPNSVFPPETWKTVNDLEPQLKEIDHRIKANDYNVAARIMLEIDPYLLLCGAYKRIVDYHERLQYRINEVMLSLGIMIILGTAYQNKGQHQEAINIYLEALDISRAKGYLEAEIAILGDIGTCYTSIWNIDIAIKYFKKALTLVRKQKDKYTEEIWLNNLGICARRVGRTDAAVKYHQRALAIAQKHENLEMIAACLASIGNCYADLGDPYSAIDYYHQSLDIQDSVGNLNDKGSVLHSLAEILRLIGGISLRL